MNAVVKVGGVLLEKPCGGCPGSPERGKPPMVIVHGGGVQITRMLERMNVKSNFIEGLRVTDEQTLAAVVAAALLGEVHTKFVAALRQAGLDAIGRFWRSAASMQALGPGDLVGANVKADAAALDSLLAAGKTPVVPTLAVGSSD